MRIRQFRLHGNLTQQQLAQMTASSLSSIRRLEASGQGTIELLVRVAQALQLTGQLEQVFVPPAPSIAQVERLAQAPLRKRARQPRRVLPHKTTP